MLLERLPYLTTILRRSRMPPPSTAATVREIKKITSFTGNALAGATEEDDMEEDARPGEQEQWSTDKRP